MLDAACIVTIERSCAILPWCCVVVLVLLVLVEYGVEEMDMASGRTGVRAGHLTA